MKAKTKKIIGGTVALSLVAATAVGGTLAYLTRQTEKRANNFTFAKSDVALNAMLTEPAWDGIVDYEYDDDGNITPIYGYMDKTEGETTTKVAIYGYTDGDINYPVTDKSLIDETTKRPTTDGTNPITYGIEQSKSMIPGSTAGKNPFITNTGNQTDSWVAAKITFVYATGDDAGKPLDTVDMAKVNDIIVVDYNDQEWEEIVALETATNSKTFFYKDTLTQDSNPTPGMYGESTVPLFTTVSVKPEATNEQIDALNEIGGFVIYVEGYAVQSDVADDYNEFRAWGINAGETPNVVFNNTPSDSNPVDVTEELIVGAE